jgi:hypothetical protein
MNDAFIIFPVPVFIKGGYLTVRVSIPQTDSIVPTARCQYFTIR